MNWIWSAFFLVVVVLLALDLFVFHRRAHVIRLPEAIRWSVFWIAVGVAFSGVVYAIYEYRIGTVSAEMATMDGTEAMIRYLTAYVLEKSLSIDNIFVIALVFLSFDIKPQYRHRILYWGIIGAVAARCTIIGGGIFLIGKLTWLFYVFGGFLVVTGARMLFASGAGESDPEQPRSSLAVTLARRILPVTMEDHGGKLLVRDGASSPALGDPDHRPSTRGHLMLTRAGLALVAVEAADVVFAVDSIPAVLGVSTDPFIVITSNIFAIMGLRSLYFVLEGMMGKFRYLEAALALLLVIIGAKMCLHHVIALPAELALGLVVAVIGMGIGLSLWVDRAPRTTEPDSAAEPPAARPGNSTMSPRPPTTEG